MAMGISGLLPTLRSIIEQRHVSKYAGTKVAVDTVRPTAGAAPHDLHVIVSSTTPRTTLTRRTAPHSMAGFTKGATVARWSSVLAPRQTGVPLSTAEDAAWLRPMRLVTAVKQCKGKKRPSSKLLHVLHGRARRADGRECLARGSDCDQECADRLPGGCSRQ